jgi:hypothetical protein
VVILYSVQIDMWLLTVILTLVRHLTSGNLPMSMAQLSSNQPGNRDLAESKLPDMYFDLTDPDRMMMHLAAATYAGIPYDVAINQLIEHNQQYHPERFAQDQQSEDYDPFTLASDFLATATPIRIHNLTPQEPRLLLKT